MAVRTAQAHRERGTAGAGMAAAVGSLPQRTAAADRRGTVRVLGHMQQAEAHSLGIQVARTQTGSSHMAEEGILKAHESPAEGTVRSSGGIRMLPEHQNGGQF